jgi:hypothetical protein
MTSTFGPAYVQALDETRLHDQMGRVKDYMLDGTWHTLAEIAQATGAPEASASAQLRHCRKPRFGGWIVEKRRRSVGTWEYRLRAPVEEGKTIPLAFHDYA